MASLNELQGLLNKLKDSVAKNDLKGADSVLTQLKLKLVELPSLPPTLQSSPTLQQELALARDVYETAVLLAIKQQDEKVMERAFAQVSVFYADTRTLLPPSAREPELLGLNLLRLLVANRIAEFHTELELISPEVQAHPYVANAAQLERWLMQGAYNKLLESSKHCLSDLHAALMSQLATTVRDEVASCSERAYERLRVPEAQKLMMFDSEKATLEYAAQHGWKVENNVILFQHDGTAKGGANKELPPMTVIQNALVYAKELERIV